jgi:predicted transcriptional regulator
MAKKTRNHHFDLPPLELRCMKALWGAGKATVHEIRAGLLPDRPLAYTTVMTVMDRLARKGIVERNKRGHAHLYRPAVAEEIIREHSLNRFIENFFRGSREDLRRHLETGKTIARRKTLTRTPRAIQVKNAPTRPKGEPKIDSDLDASLL